MTQRRLALGSIVALAVLSLFAFQNFDLYNFQYVYTGTVTTTLSPTPTPSPVPQDMSLLDTRYVLVGTKTIIYIPPADAVAPPANGGSTSTSDRSLTTSYANYLDFDAASVADGDLFVAMSNVEASHQAPSTEPTTATISSYLNCNGKRISPIISKSLKRYYGNHHGSMIVSGLCKPAAGTTAVKIQLMMKSNLNYGLVHGKQQSQLIVNQYRAINQVSTLSAAYAPVSTESVKSSNLLVTHSGTAPIEKVTYQTLPSQFRLGQLVYLSSQATASQGTQAIPMYGYEIYGGSTRLTFATENVASGEVSRLGQNLLAMWKVSTDYSQVTTKAFASRSDTSTTGFTLEGANSRLAALVFDKGIGTKSLIMKKVIEKSPSATKSLSNGSVTALHDPITINFNAPGILHVQSAASSASSNSYATTCDLTISIKSATGETKSIPSIRTFKAPYNQASLSTELIYQIPAAGSYVVGTNAKCAYSSGYPVTIGATGATTLIMAYEPE